MRISVFGMGYVGAVCSACLAREGHNIIGVDPNKIKVDIINSGKSPIIEQGLEEAIGKAVVEGRLRAILNAKDAVLNSAISLICVGTPSQTNGSLELGYVRRVCEEIGAILKEKNDFHIIVIRSTVLPGTIRTVVIPSLEKSSGKKLGVDFGVASNPEFLREGTAISDFYNPPKTVIGESDDRTGNVIKELYSNLDAPIFRTDIETAEMVKYADNAWHATKICFANEIGNVCKAHGIDGHKVMDVFCQDRKLNLSPYYLKPGFAFGGSCLPKDVRALNYNGRTMDLELPLLNSILHSNQKQIQRGIQMIMDKGKKKIGILGLSFKAGTDDLRESPMVEVTEYLIGKGCDIRIYDKKVELATLVGANKNYILGKIPHVAKLIVNKLDDVLDHAETLVIGNNDPDFSNILDNLGDDKFVVDLVRISDTAVANTKYDGICW